MIEDIDVALMMKEQGGSFVKSIGEAFCHADPYNRRIIKEAWPVYWGQYKALAIQRKEADEHNHRPAKLQATVPPKV